jgi:thioredoxin 1
MSSTSEKPTEPIHVESAEHFEELLGEYDVVLVDYHADWCGPCKMLEPTVAELAEESPAAVLKVDIDELQELARDKGIRSVPTLEFYASGERAERLVGVRDKDELADVVDKIAA